MIMEEITFVIKTLERPYCVLRLVKSILKYYPDAKILIADDSEQSCKKAIAKKYADNNIAVFELPHDCGLSYGRNFLVDKVKTEYFVLLDDDFVFDCHTDISAGLNVLKEKDLDIAGGYFRNYPKRDFRFDSLKYTARLLIRGVRKYNYIGFVAESPDEVSVKYYTNRFPAFERVDIVHNFFIAKTNVIRDRCRWDDAIKIHEHTPFFIKAKRQGLKVGFTDSMSVQHKPIRTKKYNQYRARNYIRDWMKLYGFKRFVFSYNDGEKKVISLDKQ